jgi:lactoylglutathione lyase
VYESGLVNLYTNDIEAGIRFYCDLVGFTETFRTPTSGVPEHVEFELHGLVLGLGTVEAARRVHEVEATPGARAMAIVLFTSDVDGAARRLADAGVTVVVGPHDRGSRRIALVHDPDGNLVELVSTRER